MQFVCDTWNPIIISLTSVQVRLSADSVLWVITLTTKVLRPLEREGKHEICFQRTFKPQRMQFIKFVGIHYTFKHQTKNTTTIHASVRRLVVQAGKD